MSNRDKENNSEQKQNSNNEKNFVGLKNKLNCRISWYALFGFFSFIIVPVVFYLIMFLKYTFLDIPIIPGTGLIIAAFILNIIIISSVINILFLIIFVVLSLKKKFHPFLFIIPFIMIFILDNYHIYNLYLGIGYSYNNFEFESIKFFFFYNYLFLPFSYFPFSILYCVVTTFIYIRCLISRKIERN